MITGARYSKRLMKLFGNRAVPVLDTLFLLSYTKVLQTTVEALKFTEVTTYYDSSSQGQNSWVWVLDRRLDYFVSRHGWLFFAAIVTLLFLWVPYTLLLLLVQLLRKLSDYRMFNWVSRLYPVYDTHFVPLKAKHLYWFGVLLLVRGIVSLTSLIPAHDVALFLASIIITLHATLLYGSSPPLQKQSTYAFAEFIVSQSRFSDEYNLIHRSRQIQTERCRDCCKYIMWNSFSAVWHSYVPL